MKRKNIFKSLLAAAMALTMIFGAAPLSGFVGISLPMLSLKAEAATQTKTTEDGLFEYRLEEFWSGSGYGYTVTIISCNKNAVGKVVIPKTIEEYEVNVIGDVLYSASGVFQGCTGITSVVIPDSVKEIGSSTFSGCTNLKEIVIPDSVTKIMGKAFSNCVSLSKVKLSNNLTKMGASIFSGCESLKEIDIPDGIKEIGNYAFSGCTSLSKVKLSNNLEKIGTYAFLNCTSLEEIAIPGSVTEIGTYAFSGCTSLKGITIPSSVMKMGYPAFWDCNSLDVITVSPDNKNYSSVDGVLFSKDGSELITYPKGNKRSKYTVPDGVEKIDENIFFDCTYLEEIAIPDSVTNIGESAFSGCTSLSKVKLSNNLTKIEKGTFSGCTNIKEIVIPDNVTAIGYSAFSDCTNLKEIIIPDSVTHISSRTFSGCTSLSKINLPKNLTTIETYIFSGCSSLESIVIPEGVTTIGTSSKYDPPYSGSFSDCTSLKEIVIPDSVTKIYPAAFSGCTSLQEITIPDSVTEICYEAFSNCTSLESITIGSGVENLGNGWIDSCRRLANITVSPDNKTYSSVDDVLFNKDKSELLAYPIGNKRSSYTIPDGVTKIDQKAFYGCRYIETLTIPASVKEIEDSALGNCYDIRTINYLGTREQWKEVIIGADNYMFALVNVGCADDSRCDHVWGEWVVVDAATTEKEGLEKRVCSLCSAEETRKIPKLDIVKVTAIELSDSEKKLNVGKSFTITATVKPDDALNRTIIWSSSDPSIATVDENGTVTAIAEGEAIITAESADGVKAECKVTVEKAKESFGKKLLDVVTAPFRAIINLFKKLFGK